MTIKELLKKGAGAGAVSGLIFGPVGAHFGAKSAKKEGMDSIDYEIIESRERWKAAAKGVVIGGVTGGTARVGLAFAEAMSGTVFNEGLFTLGSLAAAKLVTYFSGRNSAREATAALPVHEKKLKKNSL